MAAFSRVLFHLLVFLGLSLLISYRVHGQRCDSSHDCNDNQDCTLDFCLGRVRACINIKAETNTACNSTMVQISKSALIAKVEKNILSTKNKLNIIQTAITLLRDIHPHRPFHIRFLRVDPVRMLVKFRRQVFRNASDGFGSVTNFHQKMIRIFTVIKDLHSNYNAPSPLNVAGALIPISIREFYDERKNLKFIVTDVGIGAEFSNPVFKQGVEIQTWNGIPIQEAVRRLGADSYGNNPDSQLMFGIRLLTLRDLGREVLPETDSVTVGFSADGNRKETITIPWLYGTMSPQTAAMMAQAGNEPPNATESFSVPETVGHSSLSSKVRVARTGKVTKLPLDDRVKNAISGKLVSTSSGTFGIITLSQFPGGSLGDVFFSEFEKLLLSKVPKGGVVIDVRQNLGGNGVLCQQVVSLFTSRFVVPISTSLRATRLLLSTVRGPLGNLLKISADDITRTRAFGNLFFARKLLSPDEVNSYKGPRYPGPVVVLADAETYSCGDLFVATAKDNEAALIVGIHNSTGGGGSSVTSTSTLRAFGFPIANLSGVQMRTSFMRGDRARAQGGVPIEYFGIRPNVLYHPTRRDRVDKDHDLYEFLGDQLKRRRSVA